jgi:predicted nucleic acid-binding protein
VIAVDSSSLIAHLLGDQGDDVEILDQALSDHLVVLPPVVLAELLSDPKLPSSVSGLLKALPLLETTDGYWERAGALRAKLYPGAEKPDWPIR